MSEPQTRTAADTASTPPTAPARNHRQCMESLAKAASIGCACGAGLAVATGLMSPEDGLLTGVVVPVSAGVVLAGAAACGWHMVQTAAVRVRTPLGYCAVAAAGVALGAATVGASSWSIASVLSGGTALRQHMSLAVTAHQAALDKAWAGARGEASMIDAVQAASAELRAMSDLEARGGDISGRGRGNGTNSRVLAAGADGYTRLADTMHTVQDHAAQVYEKGTQALGQMRRDVHGDGEGFGQAAAAVETTVAALNAYRLTDLANNAGLVQVQVWSANGQVQQVSSGAEKVSQKVLRRGEEIAQARQVAPVPTWTPLERREAVLRYASGAAAGGG